MAAMPEMEKVSFNQTPIFALESDVDEQKFSTWLLDNWTLPFWFSGIYLLLIFTIQHVMKDKPAFQLRAIMALWSVGLAIFSILGVARCLPELFSVVGKYGWETSVCGASFYHGPTKLWAILFILSKPYELGDTLFIVLRKGKLIFLHWYHHISAMILAWFTYMEFNATARWFINMNLSAHALMYTYYTLKALRFKLPEWIPMIITSLQTTQMFVALVVNYTALSVMRRGDSCDVTYWNVAFSSAVYFSYLILFSIFFYNRYIVGMRQSKQKSN